MKVLNLIAQNYQYHGHNSCQANSMSMNSLFNIQNRRLNINVLFPDDLIPLLDSGMHTDHPSVIIDADSMFNEDMFGYSTLRRSGAHAKAWQNAANLNQCSSYENVTG